MGYNATTKSGDSFAERHATDYGHRGEGEGKGGGGGGKKKSPKDKKEPESGSGDTTPPIHDKRPTDPNEPGGTNNPHS